MKKLKLSLQNIEGAELLTREQLKMVMGGQICSFDSQCSSGSGSGGTCDNGFCTPYDGNSNSCHDGNNGGCGTGMICTGGGWGGTNCI